MARRKRGTGIPDRGDGTGGSVISYKVKIVFNWPVAVALHRRHQHIKKASHTMYVPKNAIHLPTLLGGATAELSSASASLVRKMRGCEIRAQRSNMQDRLVVHVLSRSHHIGSDLKWWISLTVDSLVPQHFVPVSAGHFCVLDTKEKQPPMSCIGENQTYPVIGKLLLSGRVWLLAREHVNQCYSGAYGERHT